MRKQPKWLKTRLYLDREDPSLRRFLNDISKLPLLSPEETIELIPSAQNGNSESRKKIQEGNCRLLVRIAKEYQNDTLNMNDLIQEGFIGLNEAIDKFDINKNVSFANFSAWWIRMRILKYNARNQLLVRLPDSQRASIGKLLKICDKFLSTNERLPTQLELSELTNCTDKMIYNFCVLYNYGNLNNCKLIEEEDKPLHEASVESLIIDDLNKDIVRNILKLLPENDETFIKDYYGLDCRQLTIEEMATQYKKSADNIQQKIKRIIKFLKRKLSINNEQ